MSDPNRKECSYSEKPNNSNAISRQAAIDAVEKESQVDGAYGYMDTKSIVDLLNGLPSAQPEILISRKAAIDALDTAIKHYDEIAEECRKKANIEQNDYIDMRDGAYEARQLALWLNELKYLRKKIEQLTIEPERKTGRWLPDNRPGGGFWVCSCCKFPSEAFAADKLYKYCPVCGAEMRGEQSG